MRAKIKGQLLQKIVRLEIYLPVGTFRGGRYVWRENYIMKNHINIKCVSKVLGQMWALLALRCVPGLLRHILFQIPI